MPRYVLLAHDYPYPHLDLMLEAGEGLWTWRLQEALPANRPIAAVRLFNHRLLYLDYEGPISGDRGSVRRLDTGTFVWQQRRDSEVVVQITSGGLTGTLGIRRLEGDVGEAHWRPAETISREA